jgi:hypothetical protein
MANIDQHLAYFDAIVLTFNRRPYFGPNFEAMKDEMVVVSIAIEGRIFSQPSPTKKSILGIHHYLRCAPSKQGAFLPHPKPLLIF